MTKQKKEVEQLDINKSIQDVQNAIIKAINDSHLHPAIIQLILQNIMVQVAQAANGTPPEQPSQEPTN